MGWVSKFRIFDTHPNSASTLYQYHCSRTCLQTCEFEYKHVEIPSILELTTERWLTLVESWSYANNYWLLSSKLSSSYHNFYELVAHQRISLLALSTSMPFVSTGIPLLVYVANLIAHSTTPWTRISHQPHTRSLYFGRASQIIPRRYKSERVTFIKYPSIPSTDFLPQYKVWRCQCPSKTVLCKKKMRILWNFSSYLAEVTLLLKTIIFVLRTRERSINAKDEQENSWSNRKSQQKKNICIHTQKNICGCFWWL